MSKKISKNSTKEILTTSNSWSKWFPFILGLITFFVYLNSIQNGYNLDDELVTRNHPLTSKGLSAIWEIITSPYYSDDMGYRYGYRPMVHLSFAIENHFFGESPHVGHFINLLIYMSIVVLAFKFLIKLFGVDYQYIAFFAMLIFAVHPVHTEVVNSLKNRDELLALFFALISLTFLMKQNFNEKKYLWFLLFCIFLICSVLSKKSSIPIFFCAPLLFVNNNKFQPLQYFVLSFILNFLAAIFGSDFNAILSIKLFLIGGAFSISFFLLKNRTIWQKIIPESFRIKSIYSLLFLLSFLLLFVFSIFYKSHEVLIAAYFVLSIFIFLEIDKKELISFLVIFSLFVSGLFFKIDVLSEMAVMLSIFILFEKIKKSKVTKLNYGILIWLIPILFNYNGFITIDQFIGGLVQLIVLVLISKYEWLKFAVLLFFGGMIAFYREIQLVDVLFLLMLFFDKIQYLKKIKISYYYFVVFGIIAVLMFHSNNNHALEFNSKSKTEIASTKSNNIISEGRELNFVENPLINSSDDQKKLIVGFESVGKYFNLLIFPYPLKFYYGYNVVNTDFKLSVTSIVGVLFFCFFIFLVFYFVKKRNYNMLFFVFCSLLSLSLFSNWFVLVAGIIGERLVFEASFSFIFVLVYLFYDSGLFSGLFKKVVFSALFILFLGLTFERNKEWKDPLTLMGNDIKNLQNSAQANNLYALNLLNNSKDIKSRKLAIVHFKKAIQIYPDFFNVHFDLARNYLAVGDTLKSIKHFNKVIELDASFQEPYLNLVQIYNSKRDWINYLIIAKKLFKVYEHPDAYIILAKGYLENNNEKQSKKILKIGLSKFPINQALIACLKDLEN